MFIGAGLVADPKASACDPSLTNDTYHNRGGTQCTAVGSNHAVPMHKKAVDDEGLCAGAGVVAGANASAFDPSHTNDTDHTRRGAQRTVYRTTPLCRRTRRRSMARDYLPEHGLGPAPMRRLLACPSLMRHILRVAICISIYIIRVARHNVLLYVPTTLCRCTIRRSMVGDYVPVQVSSPAPTRRPAARPSLSIHIVHVVGHDVLLYVAQTLCRSTKKAVDGLGLSVGVDLVAGANASALGPSLPNDTHNQHRGTQRTMYQAYHKTAVPAH